MAHSENHIVINDVAHFSIKYLTIAIFGQMQSLQIQPQMTKPLNKITALHLHSHDKIFK